MPAGPGGGRLVRVSPGDERRLRAAGQPERDEGQRGRDDQPGGHPEHTQRPPPSAGRIGEHRARMHDGQISPGCAA